MPVITGAMSYPENLLEKIKALNVKVDALDCVKIAEEAGNIKAVNLVLLGRLSHYFNDIPEAAWKEAINFCVPKKFLDVNLKAFELGKNA